MVRKRLRLLLAAAVLIVAVTVAGVLIAMSSPPGPDTETVSLPPPNPRPVDSAATSAESEVFTFASIPDTQRETNSVAGGVRFNDRLQWLTANKSKLNLKYVWHVGDVHDWDDATSSQYRRASTALKALDRAGVPYALALGNHDTAAVCPGGSACPGANTRKTVRDTSTFNRFYPPSRFDLAGTYESGKVDNAYRKFSAGGLEWLLLNLELWPRRGAVAWANRVVAANPGHNVIVVTHSYLEADGSIGQTDGGYGATSPQYLYDNLIKVHANIRFVFSGHTGTSAQRTDVGLRGNTIHSIVDAHHSTTTNPVRLLTVDVAAGTVRSRVYAPYTKETLAGASYDFTGLRWVR